MFRLDEVVRTTALFTRTSAPTFDPMGDDRRRQRYNERTLLRYEWESKAANALPLSLRRRLDAFRHRIMRGSSGCSVQIGSPATGNRVAGAGLVEGRVTLPGDAYLWVLVHRKDINGWWPQSGGSLSVADGWWRVEVKYGGPEDDGHDFEIAALVVRRPVHEQWLEWVETARATGSYPPVQLPKAGVVLAEAHRTVKRIPDQGMPARSDS
jgi:hypothetical protein